MVTTAKQPSPAQKYPLMTAAEMRVYFNRSRGKVDSYLWYHHIKPSGTKYNKKIGKDEYTYAITPELEEAMRREPPAVDWLRSVRNGEVKDMVLDERRGKSLIGKRVTVQMKTSRVAFTGVLESYTMCWFSVRVNGRRDEFKHNEAKVLKEAE